MRARTGAGSEWECHAEIEWIATQLLTPNSGGGERGDPEGGGSGGQSSKTAEAELSESAE